jgi:NAD(P)H-nitrite reductase large subunit
MPYIGQAGTRPYADAARIAADPEYGQIVCHCERVTRGEIRDALASPVPPADTEGLRRRTRALNGRCQGFYCAATVAELLGGAGSVASAQATGESPPCAGTAKAPATESLGPQASGGSLPRASTEPG